MMTFLNQPSWLDTLTSCTAPVQVYPVLTHQVWTTSGWASPTRIAIAGPAAVRIRCVRAALSVRMKSSFSRLMWYADASE